MLSGSMAELMVRPLKARVAAIAYLRTSSATNVGADKDSDKGQRQAIEAYAKHAGHELVAEFYDKAVSGADPIETRPGTPAGFPWERERRSHGDRCGSHHYRQP